MMGSAVNLEQYLRIKKVLIPGKGTLKALQALASKQKTPLCTQSCADYYDNLAKIIGKIQSKFKF